MATREQIMTALLALLKSTGTFQTVSRRNQDPENIGPAQSPALFLVENSETYERQSAMLPPRRAMVAKALFYNDTGDDPNAIPTTAINNALDALDVALKPTDLTTGRFTLGGLAYSVLIDGEIIKSPGDVSGKSVAVVPLRIVLP